MFDDQPGPDTEQFSGLQKTFMIVRQIQLSIGVVVLAFIIIDICKRKLYIYNTTRLFMYCTICCLIGMLIVLLHIPKYFTAGELFAYENQQENQRYILKVLNKMKNQGDLWLCGLQAFINLFLYHLSYLFAILISYNVFCVITDDYRGFMKQLLRSKKLLFVVIAMLITYLLPFIFMFVNSDFLNGYFYSYGPTGFTYSKQVTNQKQQKQWKQAVLLLFCGVCSNPTQLKFQIISAFHIHIFFPITMLIYHAIIIYHNDKKTQNIKADYLNSKQKFLLNSGKISIVLFFIQIFNAGKFLLSIIPVNANAWNIVLIVINFLFDLYPFVILFFYFHYTKQQKGITHGSSTLIQQLQQ